MSLKFVFDYRNNEMGKVKRLQEYIREANSELALLCTIPLHLCFDFFSDDSEHSLYFDLIVSNGSSGWAS